MKNIVYFGFASLLLLSACSGGGKRLMVMASGKVIMEGSKITLDPGNTHTEATFEPASDEITVVSPSGTKTLSMKEPGLYLLNLKKDTIVGSYQLTGTDNSQKVITQDDVWHRVDSLTQLMAGTNVSEAGRNFNIPPMQLAKVSKNTDAQIIGPFRKIPGSFDPSVKHEVYKFYTNKEVLEIVGNAKKMMAN